MTVQLIEAQVIRATLAAIPEVQAAVPLAGATGQYKLFWGKAPPDIPLPIIIYTYLTGGYANNAQTQDSDSLWKITGITQDMPTAVTLADAIGKLHRATPVTLGVVGVEGYTWLTEETPVWDNYTIQNHEYYRVGGIYRIRLGYV